MILSVLLMAVFLGVAVMAVDVGHMRVNRADVHAAADAAALAGIEKYTSTSDAGAAQTEASNYAADFTVDGTPDTVVSFTMGGWDSTKAYPSAFEALGTAGSVPADDVVVEHSSRYVFAPALYGHATQHTAKATSIAVGVSSKSVTRSSCVSPGLMSFAALQAQLGNTDDPLTQADIDKLASAKGPAVTYQIPLGNKVTGVSSNQFVQMNLPPTLTAAGAVQDPGPPSASGYRSAFSCDAASRNAYVGDGDWVQPTTGQMSTSTAKAIAAIGQPIEVLLASTTGTPPGCPTQGQGGSAVQVCFQVKYIASFVVTAADNKSITGYFTAISGITDGVVSSAPGPGLLEVVTKTRLVH